MDLEAGTYFVEVEATLPSGGTCSDTATVVVVDPEGMVVTLDSVDGANPGEENGGAAVTVTGGVEPYDFEWTGPTGNTGAEDPDDLGSGEWTLTVTGDDGCSTTLIVSVPVGLVSLEIDAFSVHPNPARDQVTFEFGRPFHGTMVVRDGVGRTVLTWPVNGTESVQSLSRLTPGWYSVQAIGGNGSGRTLRLLRQD